LDIKREEAYGGWEEIHNKQFHDLYSSPNTDSDKVKEDEMGRACNTHGTDGK
jgi:hypothetical protein